MTLGTTIDFSSVDLQPNLGHMVRPVQLCTGWLTVIAAGGVNAADNAGSDITNPTTQITASTKKIVRVSTQNNGAVGTTLLLRMGYDAATTDVGTVPVVQVFGRRDANDSWQRLYNKSATPAFSISMTTVAASDVSDGTYKYTANDQLIHAFDLQGCNELLFGIKTAYAASDGNEALSFLQAKII